MIALIVSTRSRPKAAGQVSLQGLQIINGFNTQPPEGGWGTADTVRPKLSGFQHAAARRRLARLHTDKQENKSFQHAAARRRLEPALRKRGAVGNVSTRSRPKAAGSKIGTARRRGQFQHAAARRRLGVKKQSKTHNCGFNTQPPEGGWLSGFGTPVDLGVVSTRSRPKAAG